MIIKVEKRQSLLDIAILYTGSVENIFAIAKANNIAISDELEVGSTLIIPNDLEKNTDTLNYYITKKISPATALTEYQNNLVRQKGIGWMVVAKSFIIG